MRPPRERSARREVDPQRGQHRLDINCSLLGVLALQGASCVNRLYYSYTLVYRLFERFLIQDIVSIFHFFGELSSLSILVFEIEASFVFCSLALLLVEPDPLLRLQMLLRIPTVS